jgi:xylose isomerase
MSRFKLSAGLWILDVFAERYVPGGYWDPMRLEEQLETMAATGGLDGLGVIYPTPPLPGDPDALVKLLADYRLTPADITVDDYAHRKWRHGAFATNQKEVRRENIRLCKECVDFAARIPGTTVTLWPAHDGFDYPFQAGYADEWGNLVDSLREICAHNPAVRIAVEYKQKDPRQRQFVSNMGKTMMLIHDVGAENIAVALDTGHALMSYESLAESAVLLSTHGRLGTVHLNDNYRDADPDLVFGALAFWDNLELFYYLKRLAYPGWLEIDITSGREDRVKSANLVVKLTRKYEELAERLLARSAELEANLKSYRFADNMSLIADLLF